ncbi:MAG TPA: M17 family peptidase N-terminal domain-containing protein, partial [Candidatus Nanopelagicales bacterium]|nr:M17 family peptidase N-terminal domain-containing protein [Candidatus Nanopelagicales bacterium]
MQLRIVTDQPWDVTADVLAIPVTPELAFDGPLGELDRRSDGEVRALAAFGELTGKRFATALAGAGALPAGRLLAVGTGPLAELDRETVVHLGATIERRLAGRPVHALAIWIGDLGGALDGGVTAVAELLARGVVEGSFDPAALYRAAPEASPPALDELILVAPGSDAGALAAAAERGVVIGEGTNLARQLANRAANDVSPEVL